MSRIRVEQALWALALIVALVGWRRWRAADAEPSLAATPPPAAIALPRPIPPDTLRAAEARVAAGDPFRLDRVPAPIGSAAQQLPGAPPVFTPPPPPRPALSVSGIVGPPWQAFVEGIPGTQGTVLTQRGDTLGGGLRVRSIDRNEVVIQGPDTTWRLPVRKPWQ